MVTNLSKHRGPLTVRTFLAIELPGSVQERLAALHQYFPNSAGLRWVKPELLHVTVRFLGQLTNDELVRASTAARAAAARSRAGTLEIVSLGAFPNDDAPRVLWAALREDEGLQELVRLHAHLQQELAAQGFRMEERPFSPHVTLARTRDSLSRVDRRTLGHAIETARHEAGELHLRVPVEGLTVMRSDLSAGGPRYTALDRIPLGPFTAPAENRG